MGKRAEVIAVLDAVRDVLANPDRWVKEYLAVDAEGDDTTPYGEDAVCWCLLGAIGRTRALKRSEGDGVTDEESVTEAVADTVVKMGFPLDRDDPVRTTRHTITRFNDHPNTTHADILKLLDDTLARLREET